MMFTNISMLLVNMNEILLHKSFVLKHYTVQICSSFILIINCVGKLFSFGRVKPHCLQHLDELKTKHSPLTSWANDILMT